MIDILDSRIEPTIKQLGEYVGNQLWHDFCNYLIAEYKIKPHLDYSKCSWQPGWNVKFKKAGKNLCTLYPQDGYFTVLIVIGNKEKEAVETLLSTFTSKLQEIYNETKEGNGQRWLMIDLEDDDNCYLGVKELIALKRKLK